MKKPTVKYLSALALAIGLGSMSMLAAPTDFDVEPRAQFGHAFPLCLSADQHGCSFAFVLERFLEVVVPEDAYLL